MRSGGGGETVRKPAIVEKGESLSFLQWSPEGLAEFLAVAVAEFLTGAALSLEKLVPSLWEQYGTIPAIGFAALCGDVKTIEALHRRAADVNQAASGTGLTPLAMATLEGIAPSIRMLGELGADLEVTDQLGRTPLMIALDRGNHEAASLLADLGANLLAQDKDGSTALMRAIERQQLKNIALLR